MMQQAVTGGAKMAAIKNVAVIGNGLMGNAISIVFASHKDITVKVKAVEWVENMYGKMEEDFAVMIEKGLYTKQESEEILSRITFYKEDADVYTDADFVIECVPEVMSLKQDVLSNVENYCSDTCIIATNTSVMSVTEIAEKCKNKTRVVGAHFWNPGHLIPLVEVVKTESTSEDVIEKTMELLRKVGKKPICCKKDVPGFVANRLQHAMWREAFYMVENGIADAQTVDEACKFGPGLRWPVLGPMENSDLVSIELSYNIHDYILKHLADNHEPSKCLKEMLDEGKNGFKTLSGWQNWTQDEVTKISTNLKEYLINYNKTIKTEEQ